MKIFISWSKPASKRLGNLLREWLPDVLQQVDPWMSSEDIDKGQRWPIEVSAKLGELDQGILCVTAENLREPWLNFEAGALAKSLDDARVRPVLLDLRPSDVTGPLAHLQMTEASDKEDMLRLVKSLDDGCASPVGPARVERTFEAFWPDYAEKLEAIRSSPSKGKTPKQRSAEDLMSEVLLRVRELQRTLDGSRRRRVEEVVLGDGRLAAPGSLVEHPRLGLARIIGVLRVMGPDSPIVRLLTDKGEEKIPASELRRPAHPAHSARSDAGIPEDTVGNRVVLDDADAG
ncbi:TIR domain-containing protein [Micromonospora sp. NPDC023633]|uniref:TIR domain-containing protein n=1 Tax=Micromonospora sp. NPDC023633 TaxID=3154320 RepID=UPI0033DD475C